MTTVAEAFAIEHAKRWIDAWNRHDLKSILSMYSDNIEFSSPKIKAVFPNRDSTEGSTTIRGKKDLELYWSTALKKFPALHFTPLSLFVKNNICILEYQGTPDGKIRWNTMEKFEFEDDIITKSSVFYGVEEIVTYH